MKYKNMSDPNKKQKKIASIFDVSDMGMMNFLHAGDRIRAKTSSKTFRDLTTTCEPTNTVFKMDKNSSIETNDGCLPYMSASNDDFKTEKGYTRCCTIVKRQDKEFLDALIFSHSRVENENVIDDMFPEMGYWIKKRARIFPDTLDEEEDDRLGNVGNQRGFIMHTRTVDSSTPWHKMYLQYLLLAHPEFEVKISRTGLLADITVFTLDEWHMRPGITDNVMEVIMKNGVSTVNYDNLDPVASVPIPIKAPAVKYDTGIVCDITHIDNVIAHADTGFLGTHTIQTKTPITGLESWAEMYTKIFIAMESNKSLKFFRLDMLLPTSDQGGNMPVGFALHTYIPRYTAGNFEEEFLPLLDNLKDVLPGGPWSVENLSYDSRWTGATRNLLIRSETDTVLTVKLFGGSILFEKYI